MSNVRELAVAVSLGVTTMADNGPMPVPATMASQDFLGPPRKSLQALKPKSLEIFAKSNPIAFVGPCGRRFAVGVLCRGTDRLT